MVEVLVFRTYGDAIKGLESSSQLNQETQRQLEQRAKNLETRLEDLGKGLWNELPIELYKDQNGYSLSHDTSIINPYLDQRAYENLTSLVDALKEELPMAATRILGCRLRPVFYTVQNHHNQFRRVENQLKKSLKGIMKRDASSDEGHLANHMLALLERKDLFELKTEGISEAEIKEFERLYGE